jgi:hypothetical protein
MDARITLSFNEQVINKAKKYAEAHHISLSRLTEFLYQQITSGQYPNLEELPVSDWVNMVAEGQVEYKTAKSKSRKAMKKEYFQSKK